MIFVLTLINVIILKVCAANSHRGASNIGDRTVNKIASVTVVEGTVARLPCDITPIYVGDRVALVIWFKEITDGKLSPVYSFDSRYNIQLEQGKHWSDEIALGGRAHFRFQDEPPSLTIDNVLDEDAGIYHCRVDFNRSPTRNSRVALSVIIPPKSLTIFDERGIEINSEIIGPYTEGSAINLTCIATGGSPPPKVIWWEGNVLLDDSYENLSTNRTQNSLFLQHLNRKRLNSEFTCQASNNDLAAPPSLSVRIDLNLLPLSVKLLDENNPLSSGKSYQIRCEVNGSRPPSIISWKIGNVLLKDFKEKKSEDNNVSISILNFIPTIEDDGKYISCSSKHPTILHKAITTERIITITYSPIVTLKLGKQLKNKIREANDVYFDCNIKANPWINKIHWTHNREILHDNISQGVIINNQSLVLQNIKRTKTGSYNCIAINLEGEGESNTVDLQIDYAPICKFQNHVTYKVALRTNEKITCDLEAKPSNVDYFWTLNNTKGHFKTINHKTRTILYTPKNVEDYGDLYCKGANEIGTQIKACIFHIIPEDTESDLANCSLRNGTNRTLIILCSPLDNNSNQTFIAEIYDFQSRKLLKNLTSKEPIFEIDKIRPGSQVEINLYRENKKGWNEATRFNAIIPSREKLAVKSPIKFYITPTLAITIGIVTGIVILAFAILAVKHLRQHCLFEEKQYYSEEPSLHEYKPANCDDYDPTTRSKNSDQKYSLKPDEFTDHISLRKSRKPSSPTIRNVGRSSDNHVQDSLKTLIEVEEESPQAVIPKFCHNRHIRVPIESAETFLRHPSRSSESEDGSNISYPLARNIVGLVPIVRLPKQKFLATEL